MASSCQAITQLHDQCSRPALKTGYCKQHDKDQKIEMYKKELKRMHQRVRTYSEKTNKFHQMINDVQRCDWIKYQLSRIGGVHRPFRYIVSDLTHKEELEELFDLPFDEIEQAYRSLVDRRNAIVHKFTMTGWVKDEIPNQRVQRRIRQANIKRDMYSEAMWASDESRYAKVNPNSMVDASTQAGEGDIRKPAIMKDSGRERKRNELLEKAKRRVAQANAKRGMYADAAWSSDVGKEIDVNRNSKVDVSTQAGEGDIRKPPVMKDAEVGEEKVQDQQGVDATTVEEPVVEEPVVEPVVEEPVVEPIVEGPVVEPIVEEQSSNNIHESSTRKLDTEEQVEARDWIKAFFKKYPNWVALRIHPIRKKDHKDDKRYVIGENGSLLSVKNGKKYKQYEYYDWEETEEKVRNIWYDAESQSIDEVSAMRGEESLTRTLSRLEKKKRMGDELEELDVKLKDRRLPNITFGRKATSTKSDDEQSRMKMLWVISKNKEMLESNGLIKSIIPTYKESYKSDKTALEQYVWVKNGSIDVYGKKSNLEHRSALKKVDWQSTLRSFIQMMKDRGLELNMVGESDVERDIKDYKPYDDDEEREARHGTKTGLDEDADKNLAIPDMEAKKMLYEYYKNRYFNIRNKNHRPVSGNALQDLMKKIRWMDTFYALLSGLEDVHKTASAIKNPATEDEKEMIKNVNDNFKVIRKVIFSNANDIRQESEYQYEDSELIRLHDNAERAYRNYEEALKQVETIRKQIKEAEKEARKNNNTRTKSVLKAAKSALRAALAAERATKVVYNADYKKYIDTVKELNEEDQREQAAEEFAQRRKTETGRGVRLQGRGLRGAGIKPLEGVVRRGRTYNLNEIQGLATPSAYVYRQLGSKYIRLPDLDANTLIIVQPNRRKCGPKKDISDSLQAMMKNLVYNKDINQADYDKLSLDDKKLFKEILAITHLQYNFIDKLPDPLGSLRMEYDKLKGELMLGNDNPSIIKQLKSITIDMYSNKLISDAEFKDIITRLL
ncbi:unnamed protein product [Phytophthora lilii]|uniref:Unnamed protein product n=2 Tax=Phytophthora lilii TaxID=2077276 RepID=A0A9W6X1N5_9STRA|nr:unnamed protein product [Phytophthora lilii]